MHLSELDWAYVQERAANFTGRAWVFDRLDAFLKGPPGAFLLLGGPGTGKTAVAARLAVASAGRSSDNDAVAELRSVPPVTAAYFCRARQVDVLDAAQRLSEQLAAAVPGFAHVLRASVAREIKIGEVHVRAGNVASGGLVAGVHIDLGGLGAESAFTRGVTVPLKRLREAGDTTQVVVLVDALDEALSSKAAEVLPQLLGDVEHVHLIVTSRGDSRAIDWLGDRAQQLDLSRPPPDNDDVLEYLQHRLRPLGGPEATQILARRIKISANGNFLYAFYVVEALLDTIQPSGLTSPTASQLPLPEGGLAGIYRDFLRRELWRESDIWSNRFSPVLARLAVAQDDGLTIDQIRLTVSSGPAEPLTRTLVRETIQATRQFLDGPMPEGPFRIYHQSFAQFLVDPQQNPDRLIDAAETHQAIVDAYLATDPMGWDQYARRNVAIHAVEAGRLDQVLGNPRALIVADPDRLLGVLPAARTDDAQRIADVYRGVVHHLRASQFAERAAYLQLAAWQRGVEELAAQIGRIRLEQLWSVRWASWQPQHPHRVIGHHDHQVVAVCVGDLRGRPVAVSGSDDRTVRVWDLASGIPVGQPFTGHAGPVRAVAAVDLDGRPIVVSGSDDRTVLVWDLATHLPVGQPFTKHAGPLRAVCLGELEGHPVVVSGGEDRIVRVWDLATGIPVGQPFTGHAGAVRAVAVGDLDGRPIVVSGSDDRTVRVWDLAGGASIGQPFTGHAGSVQAVAIGDLDGRPVVVSGSEDQTALAWDLATRAPVGPPLSGHTEWVNALAVGRLAGRPMVVSGSNDKTVRVWDLASPSRQDRPFAGHTQWVNAVAVGEMDGRTVIVSGSDDRTVRVWDLADATVIGQPISGHAGPVRAVAVGQVGARPVAVSGGDDHTVRVWDLATGTLIDQPITSHSGPVQALAIGRLGTGPVVISAGLDGTVRVWDLATRAPLGEPITGHAGAARAVATGWLGNRPVVVSGGEDRTVRVWDLATHAPLGEPITGHADPVQAVAFSQLDGQPVIISGSWDGTTRLSGLDGHLIFSIDLEASVNAIRIQRSRLAVVASAGGIVVFELSDRLPLT
ncbi:MAG TPA: hypothetical protein VF834_25340 [Streptosporangiaceae bacterium]